MDTSQRNTDLSKWSISTVSFPNKTSWAIPDAAAEVKPEYLLITLGVNGVSHMNEAYFTAEYTSLVNAVQEATPDTKNYTKYNIPCCRELQRTIQNKIMIKSPQQIHG